jgi:hypothetical protein
MARNYGLNGVDTSIQLGKKGLVIGSDGTDVNIFGTDGATLSTLKAGTPDGTNNDHVVTVGYLADAVKDQTAVATFDKDSTTVSLGTVPAGQVVKEVRIVVTTAFDGTAPLITVGKTGALTELAAATVSDLSEVDQYIVPVGLIDYSDTEIIVTVTSDSSTVGAGKIQAYFEAAA